MRIFLFFVLPFAFLSSAHAQQEAIIKPIKAMFDGMREGNADKIASAFATEATMQTIDNSGQDPKIEFGDKQRFIDMAGQKHDPVWNEVIWSYDVRQDGLLASVWTEYTFYLGNNLSHCGVNVFQLLETSAGWKITSIIDTRRKTDCMELDDDNNPEKAIQEEINNDVWRPFKEAYASFDAIAMNDLHTDDVIRGTKWSIRLGDEYKKSNAKKYQESRTRADQRSIDFVFETRKANETHAIETGYYKVTSTRSGETREFFGYFHIILTKENGQWKIMYDHDTDELNGMKINQDWIAGKAIFN